MYEKIIAVTNRKLCGAEENFLTQIKRVCSHKPAAFILREKDLLESEYESLAHKVMGICRDYDVKFIVHSFINAARNLSCKNIHVNMQTLRHESLRDFDVKGVSCHSVSEVIEAHELGASYIVLGNIYETDCKKGLAGKGLNFLREACLVSPLPVYAIGGVNFDRMNEILESGAVGACMMSEAMKWN